MLEILNITEAKIKQLNRAGITSPEALISYYPKKYSNRTALTGFQAEGESVILFHLHSVKYVNTRTSSFLLAKGYDVTSLANVRITWFNSSFLYNTIKDLTGKDILVAGNASFSPSLYGEKDVYQFTNPPLFDPKGTEALGLFPIYKKIRGMADDYLKNCIKNAINLSAPLEETLPLEIVNSLQLLSHKEMVAQLHTPTSEKMLIAAQYRRLYDDLIYFALRIELNYNSNAKGSAITLSRVLPKTSYVLEHLPYQLTPDQAKTVTEIMEWIRSGKRVNALVQGDVGTGKSIIAYLLAIAMAESGHQCCIMAPTQILANQHYEDLKKLATTVGFDVICVNGKPKRKAEQFQIEQRISSGDCKLICGTQALLSDTYQFQDLGLVISDEEHKYGVIQKQKLAHRAAGTHTILMSATPIPRSLAATIFGDNLQLYSILTKPAGRKPVITAVRDKLNTVFPYVYDEAVNKHHQVYVVCPLIDTSESDKLKGIATAEKTYELYQQALGSDVRVALVTGKTKKGEAAEILAGFGAGDIDVLVSTTVIEVGVNVPNACTIIIHNAERFGLAQLHQLRGRVGRGSTQAYCILISDQKDNPRLRAMCQTNDGFKIAEMDLQQRGAGDLLGCQQSGTEKFLAESLAYPHEYEKAKQAACYIINSGKTCKLLSKAIEDNRLNIGGVMDSCR